MDTLLSFVYLSRAPLLLQVPWTALRAPVVVELSDVHLCIALRRDEEMTEGPAAERSWLAKQAEIAAAELGALAAASSGDGAGGGGRPAGVLWSFVQHVLAMLVNRLQLSVSSVHIEFEVGATAAKCQLQPAFGASWAGAPAAKSLDLLGRGVSADLPLPSSHANWGPVPPAFQMLLSVIPSGCRLCVCQTSPSLPRAHRARCFPHRCCGLFAGPPDRHSAGPAAGAVVHLSARRCKPRVHAAER